SQQEHRGKDKECIFQKESALDRSLKIHQQQPKSKSANTRDKMLHLLPGLKQTGARVVDLALCYLTAQRPLAQAAASGRLEGIARITPRRKHTLVARGERTGRRIRSPMRPPTSAAQETSSLLVPRQQKRR